MFYNRLTSCPYYFDLARKMNTVPNQQQQQSHPQPQPQQTELNSMVSATATIAAAAAPTASQYKMKSKMMNKFFNDPVEALDLRLGRAEDNIKSVEFWLPNPLTHNIKQEELYPPTLLSPDPEVKLECPVDYSEVQVATPPSPLLSTRQQTSDERTPAAVAVSPPLYCRQPLSPMSEATLDETANGLESARSGSGFGPMAPQRVILNPSGQQEMLMMTCRSPSLHGGRYSPYPPVRRGSVFIVQQQQQEMSASSWGSSAHHHHTQQQQRLETGKAATSPPHMEGIPTSSGGGDSGRYFPPTSQPQFSLQPQQPALCRIRPPCDNEDSRNSNLPPAAPPLSPLHPALHGLSNHSSLSPVTTGTYRVQTQEQQCPQLPSPVYRSYHRGACESNCGAGVSKLNMSTTPFPSSSVPASPGSQARIEPASRQAMSSSLYLHTGGDPSPAPHGHQHHLHPHHHSSPHHMAPPSHLPAHTAANNKDQTYSYANSGNLFSNGYRGDGRLTSPSAAVGGNRMYPSMFEPIMPPIKLEAVDEDEEEAEAVERVDISRVSFSDRCNFARSSLRHDSGSSNSSLLDSKPLLLPLVSGDSSINMDDKIALAENMMSAFNGNPLLQPAICSSSATTRSEREGAAGALNVPASGHHRNQPGLSSPQEQEQLPTPAAYYNSSHLIGQQSPGSMRPFWGMRGGPPPPSTTSLAGGTPPHHGQQQPQYLKSRSELMQDYAVAMAAATKAAQNCRRDLGWGGTGRTDDPAQIVGGSGGGVVAGDTSSSAVRHNSVIVRADKQANNKIGAQGTTTTTSSSYQHMDEVSRQFLHHHNQARHQRLLPDTDASGSHGQHLQQQQHSSLESINKRSHQQHQMVGSGGGGTNNFLPNLSPKERELHNSWLNLQSARMCSLVQQATDRSSGGGGGSSMLPPDRIKLEDGDHKLTGLHKYPGYLPHAGPFAGPAAAASSFVGLKGPVVVGPPLPPSFPGLKSSYPGLKPYHRPDERPGHHQHRLIKEERKAKLAERIHKDPLMRPVPSLQDKRVPAPPAGSAATPTITAAAANTVHDNPGDDFDDGGDEEEDGDDDKYEDDVSGSSHAKGKRGRPRKHAPKIPLPPLYVFIRNLLHNPAYNPGVVTWVDESSGCFKVTSTTEFAKTWGKMKSNRSEEMNYEKMSRAMRYHYGSERQGRKGHLAMVKEKRLFYKFGELAVNWRTDEMSSLLVPCVLHDLCRNHLCLWTKE